MKKIDCIVYSFNRACQLDLLLRSVRDKFLNVGQIYVLYTYTDDFFKSGYEKLIINADKYDLDTIFFYKETDFEKNVKDILNRMTTDCFLGLCDDDVFIRETDCTDIASKLDESNVSSISLKAGLHIIENYPRIPIVFPNFLETEPYLKWKWRDSRPDIDWGYPTCVNSYIFKKNYFLDLIDSFHFKAPPYLEAGLNTNRAKFKDIMYSFQELKLLNIPCNRIQTLSPNAFANTYFYDIKTLNEKFLNKEVISTKNLYSFNPIRGNEEVEFIFETE